MPRAVNGVGHLPELCAAEGCIRQTESGSVSEVEKLRPNLELHIFADGNFFAQRKVGVMNPVGPEIGKVTGGVSSNLVSRVRETSTIDTD